jgi:hypothetical protein
MEAGRTALSVAASRMMPEGAPGRTAWPSRPDSSGFCQVVTCSEKRSARATVGIGSAATRWTGGTRVQPAGSGAAGAGVRVGVGPGSACRGGSTVAGVFRRNGHMVG